MCARNWTESDNQGDERGSRGDRVRKKSQSNIATRKTLSHDSGAHHGRHQERSPNEFRSRATRE